ELGRAGHGFVAVAVEMGDVVVHALAVLVSGSAQVAELRDVDGDAALELVGERDVEDLLERRGRFRLVAEVVIAAGARRGRARADATLAAVTGRARVVVVASRPIGRREVRGTRR